LKQIAGQPLMFVTDECVFWLGVGDGPHRTREAQC
jgi:hypothetical protein